MPVEKGFLPPEIPGHARVYLLLLRARRVVPVPIVLKGLTGAVMDMPGSSIAALRCLLAQLQAFLVSRDELFRLRLVLSNCPLLAELRNLFWVIGHSVLLPEIKNRRPLRGDSGGHCSAGTNAEPCADIAPANKELPALIRSMASPIAG